MQIKAILPALFFVLGISFSVRAQNTILWEVKRPGSERTSYLLGTFHQMGNSFVDSHPQITQALLRSELAVFESIDSSGTVAALLNSRPDDFTYRQHLKKADLDYLHSISADWGVHISKLTPMELLVKLTQEYSLKHCGTVKPTDSTTHFDKYLLSLAKRNAIKAAGLENDSLQTADINAVPGGFTWQQAEKPLATWLANLRTGRKQKQYCYAAREYMNFKFDYRFQEKCGESRTLKDRNDNWMKQIPAYLESHNTFFAVGLLHLYGNCGLIMQLREKGYTVTPVSLKK